MSICTNCGHQPLQFLPLEAGLSLESYPSVRKQRAALAETRCRIALYKKHITMLEKKQDELEAGLSLVTYPVLKLPVEITSRVFLCCLPTGGCVVPSSSNAPLLLAQICRHWRDVALSTPQLWNSIRAMGENPPHALFQSWFIRARGTPLSLDLARPVPTTTLDLILSYAGQIQNLDLRTRLSKDDLKKFRPLLLPQLRRFATDKVSHAVLRKISKHAPALHELRLRNHFDSDFSANLSLPSLSHLDLSGEISTETFLDAMRNFPSLQHLAFSLSPDHYDSTMGVEVIPTTFPLLSSLKFRNRYAVCVLRLVTLPNLHSITIPGASSHDLDSVRSFTTRSSCIIDHLTISFPSWDEVVHRQTLLPGWFSEFPSVSTLGTMAPLHVSPPFDLMIRCLATPSILPQLTDATIVFMHEPPSVDHEAVVKMLAHRTTSADGAKLRKFRIQFFQCYENPWSPNSLVSMELHRMIAAGLDFVVETGIFHGGEGTWHTWPSTYYT
ncbi:hypothetical protein DFH06DRAFT_1222845 [Mycena polygramma]|nr:hypothetical protein DFH06DRAFT_1222845 [Mycena polygramma]